MTKLLIWFFLATVNNAHRAKELLPIFGEPIQNISTSLGRDVTFYCKIHNIGRYKAEWSKIDDNGNHWSIGALGSRVSLMYVDETTWPLRIMNVRNEDRGTYMCKVNTVPITMQVAYLHVAIPPRILDEETRGNVRIEEGSPIALVCKGSGSPHPSIGWRREGNAEITYFSKYHGLRKVRYYVGETLQLHQVSREDAGIYYCLAVNGVPPIPSKRIILEVFFRPEMRVVHYKIEANLEDDVALVCKVESYPKPESSWSKSGEKVEASDVKYITSEAIIQVDGSYFVTMTLTIKDFGKEDIANYVCASTNSLGYSEATIKVTGRDFEYFDEEELTEFGGREINCILDLKRNSYINPCCRRTKIGIPYHGKMIYLHQKRERVFEPSPCSTIINSFRPEMKVPHYRIDSAIGEDASIVCTVEAYPKPINTWLHAGKTKLSTNSKFEVLEVIRRINFSYVIKMKLTVKNFTESDSTIYTCGSRNMLGYSESSIKINAKKGIDSLDEGDPTEKPGKKTLSCLLDFNMNNYLYPCCRRNPYPGGSDVMVEHHFVTAISGNDVNINCTVLYNPSNKNKWSKMEGNKMLSPNEKYNLTLENLVKSRFYNKMDMILTVKNITTADDGSYVCSTRSSLEYKEVVVKVTVANETKEIPSSNVRETLPGELERNGTPEAVVHDVEEKLFFTPEFERGKPQVQTPCYKVEHKFGEDIVLVCSVKAFPRPINAWRKHQPQWLSKVEDDTLKTNKKYEVNEEHSGFFKITMRLTIRSFSKHDETSYTCSSSNSYGAAEATIKVFGMPKSRINSKLTDVNEPDTGEPEVVPQEGELPEGKLPDSESPDIEKPNSELPKLVSSESDILTVTDNPTLMDISTTDVQIITTPDTKPIGNLSEPNVKKGDVSKGSLDIGMDEEQFLYSYEEMDVLEVTTVSSITENMPSVNITEFSTTVVPYKHSSPSGEEVGTQFDEEADLQHFATEFITPEQNNETREMVTRSP